MKEAVDLSVIIPVILDVEAIADVYRDYKKVLTATGKSFEVIYVVDGHRPQILEELRALKRDGEVLEILSFEQPQGEAAALHVGFQKAVGRDVLTLSASHQILVDEIPKLLDALADTDMVIASRMGALADGKPSQEGKLERVLRVLLGSSFRDIRCGVRAMRGSVAKEVTIYGNQQRFLPLIAQTQGFSVREIEVRSDKSLAQLRSLMKIDFSIMLDVMTIYFLIRFTKKPFRFFGGFGFGVLLIGALITAYLIFARLFLDVPLVDRPALILSSLMIVLGIQIVSVGLIGEIIAFSFAKDQKEYKVERIVE